MFIFGGIIYRLLRVQSWRRRSDRMRRRAFLLSLVATPLGAPAASAEPSSKIPRVGILSLAENEADSRWKAFREGLHELGYIEGRNIILEYRFAPGDFT